EAEEALSTVSRRLIDAQEQERARLSRELHDDISQRLALLVLNLEATRRRLVSASRPVFELGNAIEMAATLASDGQNLAHHLHSSKLKVLGLEAAARGVCRELPRQGSVKVTFYSENVPSALPEDLSICVYRVLQEALQNAIKHSGSAQVDVALQGNA